MAVYNEILAGRFNRALQKIMGIKGPPPTPQLSSEIMPVISMFYGAEHRFVEGWYRYAAFLTVAAVAADVNALRMRNPTSSGAIVVFEKIYVQNAAGTIQGHNLTNGPANTDLATALTVTTSRLDPRGQPTPILTFSSTAAVSIPQLPNTFWFGQAAVNGQLEVLTTDLQEIPLLPGDAIQDTTSAVNVALSLGVIWRERPLEDSEKS